MVLCVVPVTVDRAASVLKVRIFDKKKKPAQYKTLYEQALGDA